MSEKKIYRYPCHMQNELAHVTVRECDKCRREHGVCEKYRLAIIELLRGWEM